MQFPNLSNVNFFDSDTNTKMAICNELINSKEFITQMYNDICDTLNIGYRPVLNLVMYNFKNSIDRNGGMCTVCCPGFYTAPGLITIGLVDCYIAGHDNGKILGIEDINATFKASIAYAIIHELSHSMQFTFVHSSLIPAMEWANDYNVWNNLFPAVAPMLKKKYKIKIQEEITDITCGKVYSYKYTPYDPIGHVLGTLITSIFMDDEVIKGDNISEYNNQYHTIYDMIMAGNSLKLILRINGGQERVFMLVNNGVINEAEVYSARNFMTNIPVPFDADAQFDRDKYDSELIFLEANITNSTHKVPFEPFFDNSCDKYCDVCPYMDCPIREVRE